MKRKLTDLKPNEYIYVATKKQACRLKKQIKKQTGKDIDVYFPKTLTYQDGKIIQPIGFSGIVYPASDFLPKKKSKTRWMKMVESQITRFDIAIRELQGDKPQTNPYIANRQVEPKTGTDINLEPGKWYKNNFNNLFFFTGGTNVYGRLLGYGFCSRKERHDLEVSKMKGWSVYGITEATQSEVFEALKKEAVQRGLVLGNYINNLQDAGNYTVNNDNYSFEDGVLWLDNMIIFEDGYWSTVVNQALTELPEKWAVMVDAENASIVENFCKFSIEEKDFGGFIDQYKNYTDYLPEKSTEISTEDFKRLVFDVHPKEIDWSVPQFMVHKDGQIVFSTGLYDEHSFTATVITESPAVKPKGSTMVLNKEVFKPITEPVTFLPYTGDPITLSNNPS